MQSFRSLIGTLKGRLRNNQDEGMLDNDMVDYQDDLERRLQHPVVAGERQPAAIGGK
jgi:hypothetical protein